MRKNIVLVGLMGAGKSSVGKLLSEKTNMDFIDIDTQIEITEAKTISEIFDIYGENYFRELETRIIKAVSLKNNQVISTGGGSFQRIKNIEYLKNNGLTFYLKANPVALYERIKLSTNRPLLNSESPLETLALLLAKREQNYLKANYIIDTENKNIDEVTSEIIKVYNDNT